MPDHLQVIARPVTALLLLALGLPFLTGADESPAPSTPATPPVPSVSAETAARDLLTALPPVPSLVEREGKALWTGRAMTWR